MKQIKLYLSAFLTLNLLIIFNRSEVYAFENIAYKGKIIEIIDGDSVKIRDNNENEKYIKLIGIDSKGYDLAYNYLNNEFLGRELIFSVDSAFVDNFDRWSYAYLYDNEIFVNKLLLEKGYAKVNSSYKYARQYNTMLTASVFAKNNSLGLWSDATFVANNYENNIEININTASENVMKEYLYGIDDILARRIVKYRNREKIRNISDLLHVDGYTTDIYYKNLFNIKTSTDINKAKYEELLSLGDITENEVNEIILYREKHYFEDISQLFKKSIITKEKYDDISSNIYVF